MNSLHKPSLLNLSRFTCWLVLFTCGLGLPAGFCSDLEVTGNLKVDAQAGIGTAPTGAILGVRGGDATAPLVRFVQDLGTYSYPPPPLFNLLEIETHNPLTFPGQTPDARRLTLTGGGFLGLNTATPNVALDVVRLGTAQNLITARFANPSGRSIIFVPRLGDGGYNWHATPDDAGLFWNDTKADMGRNLSAGFVIAPQFGSWSGLRIDASGNVGIGTRLTTNPNGYKLAVNGKIGAKEVQIEITSGTWPDYVFDEAYPLMPLSDLDRFVKQQGHLPDVPAQADVAQAGGVKVGEMNTVLLKKVEELTLYVLELKRQNEDLQRRVEAVERSGQP